MIALLDANMLYPPGLRDVLMWLAVVLEYEPRWSEEIHAEWMRNVLKDCPEVTPAQLERTRRLMDQVNPRCLVTGYETRIPTLTLPDQDDRVFIRFLPFFRSVRRFRSSLAFSSVIHLSRLR